ncbi:MAG TPA: LutB/LldF family L-lactate oxidation iron-sulfur protein [Anaerolineae bacterium]|nr:LutB/LldF family L-lactate oxidation iron-sulfur protein [Anaerolineae bacterium]
MSTQPFRQRATITLYDDIRQAALHKATGRFRDARQAALDNLPRSDDLRDQLKQIRHATLCNLAEHLETFERNATAVGAHIHWAATSAEASQIIIDLAQKRGVTLVTKSKSMTTEEIHLNDALGRAHITPVETDLGEWIVQLAAEAPYHIIAPAIHKTKEEVATLFAQHTDHPPTDTDITALTAVARRTLRQKFLDAGMGITGVNVAVADTGSITLVMNEGNGRLVTTAPPIHVAIMGIEKIVPTWDEAAVWLALLARSATGQPLSIYTNIITGPARDDDPDGPEELHIVLLDNGRSSLLNTPYQEALQCIRCGACLNICPVYRVAGGHAYHSPYSGPIGAVISPLLFGLDNYHDLPQASSLCGACLDVCPARIDLPRLLLDLRADTVAQKFTPLPERLALQTAAWFFLDHRRLNAATPLGRRLFASQLPPQAKQPTKSFRQQWQDGELDNLD